MLRAISVVRRWLALVAILALSTAATVACGPADTPETKETKSASSRGCTPAHSLSPGSSQQTLVVGGQSRSYLLRVPPGYDGSVRTPVVVLFHGLGGAPESVVNTTSMGELADDNTAILVAPLARGKVSEWDFRSPISEPTSDLAFVRDLVEELESGACVDSSRLYAAGFSNGSALAFALACDGTTTFAAYAGVSGPYWADSCTKSPPASVIYFHGLQDKVVDYDGADTVIGLLPPVNEAMASWAAHDACPAASATTTVSQHVRHFTWEACRGGSGVDVYVVDNGGHRWPGGERPSPGRASGVTTHEINASALIWGFFDRHALGGQ